MGQTSSQSDSDKTPDSNRPALSRLNASILLYCITTVVIGFLVGSVLYGLGRLPLSLVNIASSVGAAIAFISGVLGATIEKSFPKGIWQNANRRFAIIASILSVILLTAFTLAIPPATSVLLKPTATIQPSPINTPNPSPTLAPTDTPTLLPTPTPTDTPIPPPTPTPTPTPTLTPSPTPTPPCINVDQPSITLYSITNPSQTVVFTNCRQDTGPVSIAQNDGGAGWLSASPNSTSLDPGKPFSVTISGNFNSCSTCQSGKTYTGTVTATITTSAGTSSKVVNVTFVVQIG